MLQWNVYIENVNRSAIEVYNIFDHGRFVQSCAAMVSKVGENRAEFDKKLRSEVMYYFWSKCEWEIILDAWPSFPKFKPLKVSVYDQVNLNWDIFADYVWNHRIDLTLCADGS